ncbi:Kazal-type serine protease inhibitor [Flavobacteriales bacterium]|nr:Kazal-type serine protease inhibitor [Flavobacteriales bacterium]
MKKLLYIFLVLTLMIRCSDGNEILGSCYVSPNPEIICTEEYDPVCACNNLVYGNSCEAEKAGNLHYKSTNKNSGEACNY